jgi:hypothetical protein
VTQFDPSGQFLYAVATDGNSTRALRHEAIDSRCGKPIRSDLATTPVIGGHQLILSVPTSSCGPAARLRR